MNRSEKTYAYPHFSLARDSREWETKATAALTKYEPMLYRSKAVVSYCVWRLVSEESNRPMSLSPKEGIAACEEQLYRRLYDRIYQDYYLFAPPSAFASKGRHPRKLIESNNDLLADLSRRAQALSLTLTDMQVPLDYLRREDEKGAVKNWGRVSHRRVDTVSDELTQFFEDSRKAVETVKSRMRSYNEINEAAMSEPCHAERVEKLLADYVNGDMLLSKQDLPAALSDTFLTDLERYRVLKSGCLRADTLVGQGITACLHNHMVEVVLLAASGELRLESWLLRLRIRRGARRILRMARALIRPSAA